MVFTILGHLDEALIISLRRHTGVSSQSTQGVRGSFSLSLSLLTEGSDSLLWSVGADTLGVGSGTSTSSICVEAK